MTRNFTRSSTGFARRAIFALFLVGLVSTTSPAKAADFSFSRSDVSTSLLSPVTAADVNGDGKLDLIGCVFDSNANQYEIDLALGHGDGTFSPPTRVFSPVCNNVAVADTNGDGKLDLIVSFGELWVFLGNGDGTFITNNPVRSPAPASPYAAIVVDLNGDGKVDIILAEQDAGIAVGFGRVTAGLAASRIFLLVEDSRRPRSLPPISTGMANSTWRLQSRARRRIIKVQRSASCWATVMARLVRQPILPPAPALDR